MSQPIRIIEKKVFGPDENGDCYTYIRGFCDSSSEKPTELIAEGSNLINIETGAWLFFNEESRIWRQLASISVIGSEWIKWTLLWRSYV